MTAQDKPYPVVELLIETFGDWLKHRRELNEMRQMDPADFDRIASELRALGIDQADLVRTEPLVLRDMERVCALCHHKRQCDRDLAAGTSAEQYEGYCPNAPTIDGLGQTPERFG
jgi:hypothetical protein